MISIRRLLAITVIVFVMLGAVSVAASPRASAHPTGKSSSQGSSGVDRVLIFSIPHVSWADLDRFDLRNLRRLLDRSAIADLTTRVVERETPLADGYVTLGAGTRAVGSPGTDGDVLGVDEAFGRDSAAQVFGQRTGREATRGLVSLGLAGIVGANDSLLYDAEIGALGDALADAKIDRAVIANGDGAEPDTSLTPQASPFQRPAGLALMTSKGTVPHGRVDAGLLERDPDAPYGVRLDEQVVVQAFEESWHDASVVLVEGSDLVRADSYRTFTTEAHRRPQLRDALRRTDHLLGELLERVDLERDAVIVLGPAHSSSAITLTPLGIHAPGVEPGLLRSATTRRSGFVQLIDIGPTILELVGVDRPTSMEGRSAEAGDTGGTADDRRQFLIDEDAAAQFRDLRIGEVIVVLLVFAGLLVAAALGWMTAPPRRAWLRRTSSYGALAVIGFVPAAYLARIVALHEAGIVAYWAYLLAITGMIAAIAWWVGRRCRIDSLIAVLVILIAVLVFDIVRGAPFMLNSAFGYSPTVAGRFAGFGNHAYAAFAVSALLLAALVIFRSAERAPRGLQLALIILGGAIVVDGAPWWGSDVGGILSMVPAYAVFVALVLGWQIRARTIAWGIVGFIATVAGFTALDLLRSPDQRTHLGRLAVRVGQRGVDDLAVILQRKLEQNLDSLSGSWLFMIPNTAVLVVWLARRAPERLRTVSQVLPQWRPAWISFVVLAVLGYALNDSGIAVPGMMLVIFTATLVFLLAWTDEEVFDPTKRAAASKASEGTAKRAPAGRVSRSAASAAIQVKP